MESICTTFVTIITQVILKLSDTDTYIFVMNQANILIKNLFDDNDNLTNSTPLQIFMIFQRYDKNKIQSDISKVSFYNFMIISLCFSSKKVKDQISPHWLQIFSIVKNELFEYLRLPSIEFDMFMKEVIIESSNNKENIDVKKLINELTIHKK